MNTEDNNDITTIKCNTPAVPSKPGDPAPVKCSKCGTVHRPVAPPRGDWSDALHCCGFMTVLYWSGDTLKCDGYCDPVVRTVPPVVEPAPLARAADVTLPFDGMVLTLAEAHKKVKHYDRAISYNNNGFASANPPIVRKATELDARVIKRTLHLRRDVRAVDCYHDSDEPAEHALACRLLQQHGIDEHVACWLAELHDITWREDAAHDTVIAQLDVEIAAMLPPARDNISGKTRAELHADTKAVR